MNEASSGEFYATSYDVCLIYGIIDMVNRFTEPMTVKKTICLDSGVIPVYVIEI